MTSEPLIHEEGYNPYLIDDQVTTDHKSTEWFSAVEDSNFRTKNGANDKSRQSMSTQEQDDLLLRTKSIIQTNQRAAKIDWYDLWYTVDIPKGKKLDILKGCSGVALPGQSLFIMGASGAGKTSLLNVLSDRVKTDRTKVLEGRVTVNNLALTQGNFGTFGAYVMQDDVIFEYFTVMEALTFAARLRLRCSKAEQDERVQQLLKDLGLLSVQNTRVGSVQRKTISGGERKRTSIGVELITDPSVLILDEPTSGLDSFRALQIVTMLQNLARNRGKTIISTIH